MEKEIKALLTTSNIQPKCQLKINDIKFDFCFYINQNQFLLETCFYNASGSKLKTKFAFYKEQMKRFNNLLLVIDGAGVFGNENLKQIVMLYPDRVFNYFTFKKWLSKLKT